ncbi:MAG: HlyD family type I secretion periplasmic adaptor subunit [Rhodospirillaceae bacterium]|jgi:membrane fusion protein, adhesin transport system|nr:HlyD family type I secretion periplasmic adaptor subunit [Rhodospirillaceae bacterium]MBT4487608.1 HlyD family type I secretion periplasmic adaptor subunit [Rhodospirillaceae bacterium]MBT5192617.1 HlyD family type I secretion periplasmic adaptor subunit [Rhodospirillaceae bacterium]MBT5894286.1 HlyD family type I secretion periplasmic adaptor subunit [Rhodospirillaceae bacterium]MBT6430369.1 HlyD family type I secretion periplasmic adaptor subunit [Rhodospirillaceae bacterium]
MKRQDDITHAAGMGRSRAVRGEQLRFLSKPELLEEVGPPRFLRLVLFFLALTVFGSGAWASIAKIKETTKAMGEVVPIGSVHAIQHLEGGIIASIMVSEGELVEQGQILVKLDPTPVLADLEVIRIRRAGLQLKAERLRAFATGEPARFPKVAARFTHMVSDQKAILAQNRRAQNKQQRVLELKQAQRKVELSVLRKEATKLRREVAILVKQKTMQERLLAEKLVSNLVYFNTLREFNTIAGELDEVVEKAQRARRAIAEAGAKIGEMNAGMRDKALDEMGGVRAELTEVEQSIVQAEDRARRLEIMAPLRGIVQELAVTTVGSVIAPGAPLAKVVPVEDELIVEAQISPIDVGHVQVGKKAKVKITTFDFARFGAIDGEVEKISPTTFKDQDGTVYYKADVRLSKNYVGDKPGRNLILPGMVAEVDILAGERTVLRYLLRPVYQSLDSAMTER